MSFFSSGPADEVAPRARTPHRRLPDWLQAPQERLGGIVPLSMLLTRTARVAIALDGCWAPPSGCALRVRWMLRRPDESDRVWRELAQAAHGHFAEADPDEDLVFGVELADGRRARTVDRGGPGTTSDGPVLRFDGGSASSADEERASGERGLWLHPLPPAPTLRLVHAWRRLGVDETVTTIETAALQEAAARSQWFWDEDASLPVEDVSDR
jgi:hypothetical protein